MYQTRCITCWDRDLEKATLESNGDRKKLKELKEKIIPFIYVRESCRSAFERGLEHTNDSHFLKHELETHEHEDLNSLQFGMKVLAFPRTNFTRQIIESVKILKDLTSVKF